MRKFLRFSVIIMQAPPVFSENKFIISYHETPAIETLQVFYLYQESVKIRI